MTNLKKVAEEIKKLAEKYLFENANWIIIKIENKQDCKYFRNTKIELATPEWITHYLMHNIYYIKNKNSGEIYAYIPQIEMLVNSKNNFVNLRFFEDLYDDDFTQTFNNLK